MQDTPSRSSKIWPWAITVFLILFAGALVAFVIFTLSHRSELVSPDYYQDELQYQQRIDSQARTEALEEKPELQHRAAQQELAIRFPEDLRDKSLTGVLTLYRPSDAGLDQIHALKLDDKGTQVLSLAGLKPGLWRMRLEWKREGLSYYQEEVLVLE